MDYLDRSFSILVMLVNIKEYLIKDLGFNKGNGTLFTKELSEEHTTYVKFDDTRLELWTSKDNYNRASVNYSLLYDMVQYGMTEVKAYIDNILLNVGHV